jgi:hypothetical protein
VFRRTAKPKEPRPSGAYFEANRQYIAPIPIPHVGELQRDDVSARARKLEELHTRRRDTIQAIDLRINSPQMRPDERKPNWIWADVRDPAGWAKANPLGLHGKEVRRWANSHYAELLDAHLSELNDRISFGQAMVAIAKDGQLKFFVGNECVIDGVFVDEDEVLRIERQMDDHVYELYGLTANEREIIEAGTEQRANARIPRVQL